MKTRYVNSSSISIHTDAALRLCKTETISEKDHHIKIPSIFGFGHQLIKIWANVKNDDPYAEFILIQIEKKLDRASNKLDLYEKILLRKKSRRKLPEGINIVPVTAIEPTVISVDDKVFHTPHSKYMLILLARYDSIMRMLQSYRQFGVIENTRYHTIKRKIIIGMRAVLMEPRNYKATGVTRRDIFSKTERGREVTKEQGMISLSILKRQERPQYGPRPKSRVS